MEAVDILQGLKQGGAVLLNSSHPVTIEGHRTHNVDLTAIAIARNLVVAGSPVVNSPLLGAMAKLGVITLDAAIAAIREMFPDIRNIGAAEDAYRELIL